jgi:hypothetical protein
VGQLATCPSALAHDSETHTRFLTPSKGAQYRIQHIVLQETNHDAVGSTQWGGGGKKPRQKRKKKKRKKEILCSSLIKAPIDHVNHGEEVSLVGELEPTCQSLLLIERK